MILNGDDILEEIDETIDQLLQNADVLKQIASHSEYREEKEALEKTQDSLLAHLIHMDCLLDRENISPKKRKKTALNISEKLSHVERFDKQFIQKIYDNFLKPISTGERRKLTIKKVVKPIARKRRSGELVRR